jgi:hypothetical protein
MIHVLVTSEQAAILRERLKKKLAERRAAEAAFGPICARLATAPRSSFGKFTQTFEEIGVSRDDAERVGRDRE